MSDDGIDEPESAPSGSSRWLALLFMLGGMLLVAVIVLRVEPDPLLQAEPGVTLDTEPRTIQNTFLTNIWEPTNEFVMYWEKVPDRIRDGAVDTGERSNVRRRDYAGAESCQECHEDNYHGWAQHPHRFMSSMATKEFVLGDFSGNATIEYQGGIGRFYMEGDKYRMKLERGGKSWTYAVNRTIGSRFTQYYIGKLIDGNASYESMRRAVDHVLPLGYWIDEKQWVPTVHVFRERQLDGDETDAFENDQVMEYDAVCSDCHNTYPAGDRLIRQTGWKRMTAFSPRPVSFHLGGYLQEEHTNLLKGNLPLGIYTSEQIGTLGKQVSEFLVLDKGVSVGISCEACHHGSAKHAKNSTKDEGRDLPSFFPVSPHLHSVDKHDDALRGRSDANLNYTCAQCHSGKRPNYANGIDTWNSTEFSDATQGHCYDPKKAAAHNMESMTCLHCHNPHTPTGPKWKPTPAQDSAKCISCHKQYENTETLAAHTHHAVGSAGSQCMNCHMPKINEGLQDMVRTHHIFSPTDRSMIEANQPNACNMCHVDETIDWTIGHLRKWYSESHDYSEEKLAANYPDRSEPAAVGWLASTNMAVRLVGADVLAKSGRAMPQLLELLVKDPTLVNRQFTQRRIDELLGIKMKDMGYQFYMSPIKRRLNIDRVKSDILARVRERTIVP